MRKLFAAKALDTPPVVISTVEGITDRIRSLLARLLTISYLTNKTQSKIIIRMRLFMDFVSLLRAVEACTTARCRRRLPGIAGGVAAVPYKENSSEIDFMLLTASKVCYRDVLHNPMNVVIKLTMPLKMIKKQGSTNYTYAEQRRLLEIVQATARLTGKPWPRPTMQPKQQAGNEQVASACGGSLRV
ncbi:hypothetical protein JG688_00010229 [Phytophthora aleatoria]|uniref:Uncharacterized protein n=1 Tax=Phytophthora aleatoria TaxID=2496075 RepID=A0A8J5M1U6_9STRA|nr:hypothetical protein JG688_00010229 [Phytophthora aleatoria]